MERLDKSLSILIPVFNQWKTTARCIASILKSDFPREQYEIVIVDNASTDYTSTFLEYLKKQGEPIRIIRNKENLGYLLGTNKGWKTIETPYLLHLNNDVFVKKDCIRILMETFKNYGLRLGTVGAVQYFANGKRNPPLSWFHRGDGDVGNVFKTEVEDETVPFVECDLGGGFGCSMIKKEIWEKVGFFDEQFAPCMYEQEDYALRVKEAGYINVLAPKSHCTHIVAVSTSMNLPFFSGIIDINREKFRQKWEEKLRRNQI